MSGDISPYLSTMQTLNTRDLPDWFVDYLRMLITRHRTGAKVYGISSYQRNSNALLDEMLEEAVDIAGWGAFVYRRIQKMQDEMAKLDENNS